MFNACVYILKGNSNILHKIFSVSVPLLAFLAFSCTGFAKEFKGTSEYYVADLTTKEIALNFARDKAKQNALEQAGTYVTSLSESTNGLLTKDDIKVVTLGVAKLKPNSENINYTAPDQNGAVILSYSAVFDIDDKEVEKNIKNYQISSKELREAKIKNENQQNFINELGSLYQELQKEFTNAKTNKKSYNDSIINIQEGLSASEYRELANKYFDKFDMENALIYYKKELESYDKSYINSSEKYKNINKIYAMMGIATCYSNLHQIDKAEAILEDALKIAEEDRFKAKLLSDIAIARMNQGAKFDDVINLLNKALIIFPDDDVYASRMNTYFTYGNWRKALEDYERLSEDGKRSPAITGMAALCYVEIGNADKALQLDAIITKNYRMYESQFGKTILDHYKYIFPFIRGKAYFTRYGNTRDEGDIDKAIKEFTTYLDLAPANDFYLFQAYFHRGVCYCEKEDFKSAYNDAMMVLTIKPNYEPAKLMIKLIEEEQKERQK